MILPASRTHVNQTCHLLVVALSVYLQIRSPQRSVRSVSLIDKLWVALCFDFWQVIRDKTDDRQQSKIILEQNVPEWSDYFAKWILTSEEVEEGRESLHLINIISLLARERKWWRTDTPLRNPAAHRAQTMTRRYRADYFPSKLTKQEKATVGLFFIIHGEKKNLLATAVVTCKNHLTSPLGFMSSGRTLTSQTRQRFCLLNQPDFLGGSGRSARSTWETFGAPPDSAPSVGL